MRRPAIVALVAAVVLTLSAVPSSAAALTGSTWCQDRASLVVLGDSGSTGYATAGYSSPDDTYTWTPYGWYSRAIAEASSNYGTQGWNYARNGARTEDFLPGGRFPVTTGAIEQIGIHQPSLAIIELGGNDYLSQQTAGTTPAVTRTNLINIVTQIQTASPRTAVLLVVIWEIAQPGIPYSWQSYADAIRDVAIDRGVAMVDIRQYIPRSDLDAAGVYAPDHIHLNDAGNLIFAAAAWTWLLSC